MKIGLLVPALHPVEISLETIDLAKQINADSLWAPDHILGLTHPEHWEKHPWSEFATHSDGWFDPFCSLALLSAYTDLPLGIAVTDGTRRRAVDVVRSTLTLHHMAKGGFNLGLGAGEAENLVPFGYPFEKPVGELEAFLHELRHLLDTGNSLQVDYARLGLPLESDVGKPRVWIAAHGPRMLRLCGQYGDGWLPAWKMTPEEYGQRREVIRKHAKEAGRPMPICGLFASCILAESREKAFEFLNANPISKSSSLWAGGKKWAEYGVEHPAGKDCQGLFDVIVHKLDGGELEEILAKVPAELMEEVSFVGSVEEVLESFEAFGRAGLEYPIVAAGKGVVIETGEADESMKDFLTLMEGISKL
ncbi:MAG: LLM class flavin-dependent oxidoreductase [Deltaproteobacteria bacterium]|nr:LLM class flavin-dependent oxidoreductase [Deltaproteobacteria bacterium]